MSPETREAEPEESCPEEASDVRFREVVPVGATGTLYVDLDLGSIRVEPHEEWLVSVEADVSGWAAHSVSFSLERDGDDVHVQGDVDEFLPALIGGARTRLRVRVPQGWGLDLHTGGGSIRLRDAGGRVAADSGGGSLEVEGAAGSVLLSTGGGSVKVRRVAGNVRARTGGGGVSVRDVTGAVELRTLGGHVRIRDVGGPVDARTAAGPISAVLGSHPAGTLKTGAGPIEVAIPKTAGAELDARVTAGSVRVDPDLPFEGSARGAHAFGTLGAGGAPLVLRTTAGPIDVRQRRNSTSTESS